MKIIFAWETGSNIGHIAKMAEIARALPKKKAEIFFVLQNPAAVRPFAEDLKYTLLQAPFHGGDTGRGVPLNYADDLRLRGYDRPQTLAGLLQSWRSLYEMIKPDILFTQSSPTALIAAQDYKFKKAAFGTGFDVPPLGSPMPSMPYWEKVNPALVQKREDIILGVINDARTELGLGSFKSVAEGLEVDAEFLSVFEEFDHYRDREEVTRLKSKYLGSFYNMESGESLSWDKNAQKHILAFLQTGTALAKPCLDALRNLPDDHDIIVVAPGIAPKAREALERRNVRIVPSAVRLDKLIKKCDLGISHGSAGISSAFALHGVPQFMLPVHIEQHMFARAIGRTKSGRGMAGNFSSPQIQALIVKMLEDPSFKGAAAEIAKKYKDHNAEAMAAQIAKEVAKLAG